MLLTFLWSLEWGGLAIALMGMGREHWLAARHAGGRPRRFG
ncbi:MAG: hypothetical protein ACKO6F_11775 [Cyanobium sp.]